MNRWNVGSNKVLEFDSHQLTQPHRLYNIGSIGTGVPSDENGPRLLGPAFTAADTIKQPR